MKTDEAARGCASSMLLSSRGVEMIPHLCDNHNDHNMISDNNNNKMRPPRKYCQLARTTKTTTTTTTKTNNKTLPLIGWFLFISAIGLINSLHGVAAAAASSSLLPESVLLGQQSSSSSSFISQLHQQQQQSAQQYSFDPSAYKSIGEAIRSHPELREFAALCELEGVKEIISLDKTQLTVFAPIDRAMSDLMVKSKSRSINLMELAKHHIAQGFVMPDENTKYPHQFASYSLLSPLYLNQVQQQPRTGSGQSGSVFVNNAKILATHLIPIDADNYQTLHIIDQVLEFAYVSRRRSSMGGKKAATMKKSLSLDDLQTPTEQLQQQAAYDYYERFADLQSNQPLADLYHTRVYRATDTQHRLALGRDELNLERLARAFRQHPELRHKLYQVNESSSSLNTYFLPINSDRLEAILQDGAGSWSRLALEAHVVPDQVLFTRVMGLGQPHSTLFDRDSHTHRVSLSLAKTLPDLSSSSSEQDLTSPEEASRKLLATPLLLQATCAPLPATTSGQEPHNGWRSGLTNAEVLVANIPLSNGVLHLIKQPILVTESLNILDYLNDNDNQLSQVVSALGSRTTSGSGDVTKAVQQQTTPTKLNRFRELLARERQMLARLQMDGTPANKTILAPSDQAFARLRFDLRALVQGDESLIPRHWDASYRRDLLERLVKRHVVLQQTISSEQMRPSGLQALSDNGKLLNFGVSSGDQEDEFYVDCDGSQARLVHRDLIGANGVLHIIDRVLGEEQETVYSLLKSILLRYQNQHHQPSSDSDTSASSPEQELAQVIQTNLKNLGGGQQHTSEHMISTSNSISQHTDQQQQQSPELTLISRSIGQYLDEVANRRQLEQLATSVNISYQLAKLTSLAEGLDDWNEKFKQTDRQFTYFVPSDLAWIRLQQAQPELYKPLMYFLGQQQPTTTTGELASEQAMVVAGQGTEAGQAVNSLDPMAATAAAPKSPRSSESSHRLRQILERHLVVNRKIAKKDLSQLESLQTLGAILRLVEQPQQLSASTSYQQTGLDNSQEPGSSYAALHSINAGASPYNQQAAAGNPLAATTNNKLKSLRLGSSSANIVQSNEASNGFVYIIDNVLLLNEDADYIVQTSSAPAISSTMSSLLGAHNSAILDFIQSLLAPSPLNMSAHSILALMGTLLMAIALLLVVAMVLLVRRRRQNKLNRHQQLESGLTSSSSANSGSTSTTKSL